MAIQAPLSHYRYERKYISTESSAAQLRNFLLLNAGVFQPIYYRRQVNSLYFDTPDLEYFQQNVIGDSNRQKVRIRWYGDDDTPAAFQLEVKIKHGEIMRKETYPIEPQDLLGTASLHSSEFLSRATHLTQSLLAAHSEEMPSLRPALVNTYHREYFSSRHHDIRVTIDERVQFSSPDTWLNQRTPQELPFCILECKYPLEDDQTLTTIIDSLPLRVSKSSKYVMGVQQAYPYLSSQVA